MSDYTKLCDELQTIDCHDNCSSDDCLIVQATAAIKSLCAASAEKDERIRKLESELSEKSIRLLQMHDENARLKAERDAAVADFMADEHCDVCKHSGDHAECEINDYDCEHCKADCVCGTCMDEDKFEWRGVSGQKEG